MALSGYYKSQSRKNGGLTIIGLAKVSDISEITYNGIEKGFTKITFTGSNKFAKYQFREDEAEYTETISMDNSSIVVDHKLKFMLDRMGCDTSSVIEELATASYNGIIALIVTPNGDSFVAGYSQHFQKERPLKIVTANGTTGKLLKDGTAETVTLSSVDTAKALPFLGNLNDILA